MKSVSFNLILMGMLMGIPALAQLNESDTSRFQVRVGATGVWQQGNVDLVVLRGRLELVTNSNKRLVVKSQNNSLYQAFSGFKADNDVNSRNYFYYNPQQRVYAFAMLYVQTNYRRQVDFRWFTGAGLTWQVFQKSAATMKLSASMVYENTDFRSNQFNENFYNGSRAIELWRATVYLAGWHQLFNQRLKLFYNTYWQPGLDEVPNHRFQMDTGIDFPMWKGLNVLALYSLSFEEVVINSVKQYDRIFTFGVSYQLKK